MKIINISTIGHPSENTHSNQIKQLKSILENKNIKVVSNDNPIDGLNLIFEGWSYWENKKVDDFFKNEKAIYGLVFTENLRFSKKLNPKFYTLNNFIFNQKILSFLNIPYLFFLHYQYILMKFLYEKYELINKQSKKKGIIKRLFNKISFTISKNLYHFNPNEMKFFTNILGWYPMFKGVYMNTYSKINKFEIFIDLGLDSRRDLLFLNKKYFILPFQVLDLNFEDYYNQKEYDFIFYGRVTEKRKKILSHLKNYFKIKIISDFISQKELEIEIIKSKYILNLKQYKNQNFISTAKLIEGFNLNVPNLIEFGLDEKLTPLYLDEVIFKFNPFDINQLDKFLNEYVGYFTKFKEYKTKYSDLTKKKELDFISGINKFL